jgi:hypothetical protein
LLRKLGGSVGDGEGTGDCIGLLYHDDGRDEGPFDAWIGKFIENRFPCLAMSASDPVRECDEEGLDASSLACVVAALFGEPTCSAGLGRMGEFGPPDVRMASMFNG